MKTVKGFFYDGITSSRANAELRLMEDGQILVVDSKSKVELHLASLDLIDISDRIGNSQRFLKFENGAKFETSDNDSLEELLGLQSRNNTSSWISVLERKKSFILIYLALFAGLVFGIYRFGLPITAEIIAHALPDKILVYASQQTLDMLDNAFTEPSELTSGVQNRVLKNLNPVVNAYKNYNINIVFRKSDAIGANVFALPDGTIVYTDGMVNLAENDLELLAILAHEICHVVERHGLRNVVQDSLLGFLMLSITGDISGASDFFAGLPVVLTQLSYSRKFETEADQFALQFMQRNKIPLLHFSRIMRRLEKTIPHQTENEKSLLNYLSTHPGMDERLIPFEM